MSAIVKWHEQSIDKGRVGGWFSWYFIERCNQPLTDVRGEYKTHHPPSGNYSQSSEARRILRFARASIPPRGELLKSRLRRESDRSRKSRSQPRNKTGGPLRLLIGIICTRILSPLFRGLVFFSSRKRCWRCSGVWNTTLASKIVTCSWNLLII